MPVLLFQICLVSTVAHTILHTKSTAVISNFQKPAVSTPEQRRHQHQQQLKNLQPLHQTQQKNDPHSIDCRTSPISLLAQAALAISPFHISATEDAPEPLSPPQAPSLQLQLAVPTTAAVLASLQDRCRPRSKSEVGQERTNNVSADGLHLPFTFLTSKSTALTSPQSTGAGHRRYSSWDGGGGGQGRSGRSAIGTTSSNTSSQSITSIFGTGIHAGGVDAAGLKTAAKNCGFGSTKLGVSKALPTLAAAVPPIAITKTTPRPTSSTTTTTTTTTTSISDIDDLHPSLILAQLRSPIIASVINCARIGSSESASPVATTTKQITKIATLATPGITTTPALPKIVETWSDTSAEYSRTSASLTALRGTTGVGGDCLSVGRIGTEYCEQFAAVPTGAVNPAAAVAPATRVASRPRERLQQGDTSQFESRRTVLCAATRYPINIKTTDNQTPHTQKQQPLTAHNPSSSQLHQAASSPPCLPPLPFRVQPPPPLPQPSQDNPTRTLTQSHSTQQATGDLLRPASASLLHRRLHGDSGASKHRDSQSQFVIMNEMAADRNSEVTVRSRSSTSTSAPNKNRFSLTLPIVPPTGHLAFTSTATGAAVISSGSMPPTPLDSATLPETPGLIHVIAAQERKVLELREELKLAEHELRKLRRQFVKSEGMAAYPRGGSRTSGSTTSAPPFEETEERHAQRRSAELDRRRAILAAQQAAQTGDTKRKVFRSRHARALSLISPAPSVEGGSFDEPTAAREEYNQDKGDGYSGGDDDDDNAYANNSWAMAMVDMAKSPRRTPAVEPNTPGRPATLHRRTQSQLAKRATWTPSHAARSSSPYTPSRAYGTPGTPTSTLGIKQFADDLKLGILTFVEDLRHATVGVDSAAYSTVQKPASTSSVTRGSFTDDRSCTPRPGRSITAADFNGEDTIRPIAAAKPSIASVFDERAGSDAGSRTSIADSDTQSQRSRQETRSNRFSWTSSAEGSTIAEDWMSNASPNPSATLSRWNEGTAHAGEISSPGLEYTDSTPR